MNTGPILRKGLMVALGAISAIGIGPAALASNHSDAPLIKQDPQANLTDVYAFIGTRYDNPSMKVLNVSMSFRPFSEPGDGAQYERFADDARYSIHITDPVSGATKLRYDFSFSPVDAGYKNRTRSSRTASAPRSGRSEVGDARQNFTQTFRVVKSSGGKSKTIGQRAAHAAAECRQRTSRRSTTTPTARPCRARRRSATSTSTRARRSTPPIGRSRLGRPSRRQLLLGHPGHLRPARRPHPRQQRQPGGRTRPGRQRRRRLQGLQRAVGRDADPDQRARRRWGFRRKYDTVFFGQQTGVGVYATVSRPRVTVRKADGTRVTAAAGCRCRGSAIRCSPKAWWRSRTRIASTARRHRRTRSSRRMRATPSSRR